MKRVAIYFSKNLDTNAASVMQTRSLIKGFNRNQTSVVLFGFSNKQPDQNPKIFVNLNSFMLKLRLIDRGTFFKRLAFIFIFIRQKLKYNFEFVFSRDLLICLLLALLGKDSIWENHRFISKRRLSILKFARMFTSIRKHFNVVHTSIVVQNFFLFQFPEINSTYIPHAVEDHWFKYSDKKQRVKKNPYIVYWGSLQEGKGVQEIVEWFSSLNLKLKVDLHILSNDKNINFEVPDCVKIISRKQEKELVTYVDNSELALIPTTSHYIKTKGAVPLKLFEAIALRKKIILISDLLIQETPVEWRPHVYLVSELSSVKDILKIINLPKIGTLGNLITTHQERAKRILSSIGLKICS